ncbi:MAG: polysaccharide deacetylase family protein [Burkholderiaceae bacterium]
MASRHIPILMYHQVDARPARGTPMRGLVVSPESFARQMALLKALGYQGLCMSALMPYLRGEKHGKVCGITFDDGYLNNLEHASPVLARQGFSATCYAVSGQLGGFNVWDQAKGIAAKPLMQAHHLRAWLTAGQELGAHGRTHTDLTQLNDVQAMHEIAESKAELEDVVGTEVSQFCYPYGHYTSDHARMVQQAGYVAATTTVRARATGYDALWELPRVQVMGSVWLPQFWRKIATTYEDQRRG